MVNNYSDIYDGIATGEKVSADKMTAALNQMEQVKFRENTVSNSPEKYPSSQAVSGALDTKQDTLPAGIIFTYAGATAPSGWAFCDGAAYSRTTYKKLFDAISTTWGAGNGSTTFNIPDLRGATIRGAGTSSGFTQPKLKTDGSGTIDGDKTEADNVTVALAQRDNDAIRNIKGGTSGYIKGYGSISYSGAVYQYVDNTNAGESEGGYIRSCPGIDASRVVPTASENKVKARGVNFIIKLV